MSQKYVFKYFDVRARGERIRLLLTLSGTEFKEERYTRETWPAEKPKAKFHQLPILVIGEKVYTESSAIERHLARKFKLYGANDDEAYQIDEVVGICNDLFDKFVKVQFENDQTKKEELKKTVTEESIPKYLGAIDTLLAERKSSGYCVGNQLSYGDLAIFDIVDGRVQDGVVSSYKFINKIVTNVKANPKIKSYLDKRKQTDF